MSSTYDTCLSIMYIYTRISTPGIVYAYTCSYMNKVFICMNGVSLPLGQVQSPTQHFQLRETLRPAPRNSTRISSTHGHYVRIYTCIYKLSRRMHIYIRIFTSVNAVDRICLCVFIYEPSPTPFRCSHRRSTSSYGRRCARPHETSTPSRNPRGTTRRLQA